MIYCTIKMNYHHCNENGNLMRIKLKAFFYVLTAVWQKRFAPDCPTRFAYTLSPYSARYLPISMPFLAIITQTRHSRKSGSFMRIKLEDSRFRGNDVFSCNLPHLCA